MTRPSMTHLRQMLRLAAGTVRLCNVHVPGTLLESARLGGDLAACDLTVIDGRITQVAPSTENARSAEAIDLGGRLVLPRFVDCHTHLDKGQVIARTPAADGTLTTALDLVGRDREHWSADDLRKRMEFGLRSAYHYGTGAMRTHIDSAPTQDAISWPVFCELRAEWRDRITLQGSSLFAIDHLRDSAFLERICKRVAQANGVLGAVAFPVNDLDNLLDRMFERAETLGLDLDFHADETHDPDANALERIAAAALRHRFPGRILIGHCCSLSAQTGEVAERTLDLVAQAGLSIVALPMCNLHLQDRRHGSTPQWRGMTRVHEMTSHGIPVALGSDNTRDPFHPYGDLDMLETYRFGTRVAHLDYPLAAWPRSVTRTPARAMGLDSTGQLAPGAPADLIVFEGRSISEVLARAESRRIVLADGQVVDAPLPEFSELDGLTGLAQRDAPTS